MKSAIVLMAIVLGTTTPALAQDALAGSSEKNSAATSGSAVQERGATVGRGTRNTASTTRSKTQLL